jgi:hypothetical protein
VHSPAFPAAYTPAAVARRLTGVRARVREWLALLLDLVGFDALARDLRRAVVDDLRREARYVRALIILKALAGAPRYARRNVTFRPHPAPPGCRWRPGFSQNRRRLVARVVFKGAGLAARDPVRLAAALLAVIADANRYAALILRRIVRGFTWGLLVMTRPPAQTLAADAPAPPAAFADTS